jgi:hypothetical protein
LWYKVNFKNFKNFRVIPLGDLPLKYREEFDFWVALKIEDLDEDINDVEIGAERDDIPQIRISLCPENFGIGCPDDENISLEENKDLKEIKKTDEKESEIDELDLLRKNREVKVV